MPEYSPAAAAAEPATTVRFRVIAICSVMGVVLYLDRFCVSFAETYIKQDLKLSEFAISVMFSAFFLSYALGQTASGWMADRFGGRRMLTLYIVAWSLFTGLMGLANSLTMLVVLRLGLGLAQAGAFPTAANLIANWAPLQRRGMASSIVALGGRIGGVMSLFVTGYVILYLTPVSVSSRLSPNDILQPVPLSSALSAPAPSFGSRIIANWDSELVRRVQAAAAGPESSGGASPPLSPDSPSAAEEESLRRDLAAGLNRVLQQPHLFSPQQIAELKLEREARQLLAADQATLSEDQLERLNRLVLEAIYPTEIKKVYSAGWRGMMFRYALMGVPVALLFWWICRDNPRQHPRCNEAERQLIERGRTDVSHRAVGGMPLWELMTNRSMWFNGAMQFFTNVGWVFFMTYAPRYFIEVHAAPITQRTWMTSIPAVAACGGMFMGGMLTDPAVRWFGPRWGRSLPIAMTRFAAALTYLFCILNPSPWTAVIILSLTSLLCDMGIPAVWAFQQDVGGRYSGSVLGWGNMWGNFGAVVGPQLIGWIVGGSQSWNMVFVACAAAFVLSGVAALGVDATRPIDQ